jgi:PAS domain S-box-containing protein/diguanylate cyclase (GGDEF)-like protein
MKILLTPALFLMNKLSFKFKILASISLLFFILLFPSRDIFNKHLQERNTQKLQLIGLEYMQITHKIINALQKHREISHIYLENKLETKLKNKKDNQKLIEELKELEELLYHRKKSLQDYDAETLNILSNNRNFGNALSQFELIRVANLPHHISSHELCQKHTNIIKSLHATLLNISVKTKFNRSNDPKIKYLANMLQDKLLHIYEYTDQLKILASNISDTIGEKNKHHLYQLSSDLARLESNLIDNNTMSSVNNYHTIQVLTTNVSDTLKRLLKISEGIILNKNIDYDISSFKEKTALAMITQDELYEKFIYAYGDTIKTLNKKLEKKLWYSLIGFISILFISAYIIVAFYQSITENIKKLQRASEMIAAGNTNIHLNVEKQDEIGKALLAFNIMSDKLNKNISFLDGYKLAIDKSSIVSKTNLKGIITYANDMFCEVSGYSQEELLGSPHSIVRHPDVEPSSFYDLWDTIQNKAIWKGIVKNRRKDGSSYIVNATVLPILDNRKEIIEYVAVRHDITELEESKEEIKKQRVDLLTGLFNRNQLLEDLKKVNRPIIFYINIDDFSTLNDFYGEDAGDEILKRISNILINIHEDTKFQLYKLESDQFILLFEERYIKLDDLSYFFEKILETIEFNIKNNKQGDKNRIAISISAGAATYKMSSDYQKLILFSSIARKKALLEHKKFLLFQENMRKPEEYAHNIEWISRIKKAIEEDRIICHYQPIYSNNGENNIKYESLVRLIDTDGEAISPFFFLDIARRAKLYPKITQIVVDKAFETFKDMPKTEFSVNLCIEDILSEKTTNYIYNKLENYPNPERVIFEITESQEIVDYDRINKFIKYVKQYDVKIAIDDFGSGYANFEHILNIDTDYIKIDGSLIKNIHTDENSKVITEAIINFSKKLNRQTIVEFVHNEEIFKVVKELGADYSQGFYLGVPALTVK